MCGIAVCISRQDGAAKKVYKMLHALQHRGQEGFGIAAKNERLICSRKIGLVGDHREVANLPGKIAAGHNRYSTQGETTKANLQPMTWSNAAGKWYFASNGDVPLYWQIRQKKEEKGWVFNSASDGELILRFILEKYQELSKGRAITNIELKNELIKLSISFMQHKIPGAYSAWLLAPWGTVFVFKDLWSVHPLVFGRDEKGDLFFASETCAFDILGDVSVEHSLNPGEIFIINSPDDVTSFNYFKERLSRPAHCIFEFIYFSRPDSYIFGESCFLAREKMGEILAKKHPAQGDFVTAVPDSSNQSAIAFSHESGIPFATAFIRNHYIGRTFIHPGQSERDMKVREKFNVLKEEVCGKKIVLIDDSIVRGTTLLYLIKMLKKAGAKEVHVRICAPRICGVCMLGMDYGQYNELIANRFDLQKTADEIGADSLGHLSLPELLACVPHNGHNYCTGCFGGQYPENMKMPFEKNKLCAC